MGSEDLFTIVLGILLSLIVCFFVWQSHKQNRNLTVFKVASFCFLFVYAVIPIYYIVFPNAAPLKVVAVNNSDVHYKIILTAILGYVALLIGYHFGKRIRFKKTVKLDKDLPVKKYAKWAWASFFIGMLGLLIEINLQGGIMNSLRLIEVVRSFGESDIKDGVNNPLVFFRMFKPFMIVSFYLFYILYRSTLVFKYKVLAFVTFILTAYIIFIAGGRTHIFIFIATILIGLMVSSKKINTGRKNKTFAMFIILGIGFISLIVLDPIFAYLAYDRAIDFTSNSSLDSIMAQFSFPYTNMSFILNGDFEFRWFRDFFIWIIISIPSFIGSRIGLPDFRPLYEYNTLLQNGTMSLGGLPDDIMTFGFYQLGVIGMFITLLIFGVIISRIDKLMIDLKDNPVLAPIYFRVIVYIGMIVMYADMEGTFRGRYDVILLLFFLYDYRRYRIPEPVKYKKTKVAPTTYVNKEFARITLTRDVES